MTANDKNRADLGKDPARVSGMFDQVAAGYDRTNTAMTFGNDALWRAATPPPARPQAGGGNPPPRGGGPPPPQPRGGV